MLQLHNIPYLAPQPGGSTLLRIVELLPPTKSVETLPINHYIPDNKGR